MEQNCLHSSHCASLDTFPPTLTVSGGQPDLPSNQQHSIHPRIAYSDHILGSSTPREFRRLP